MCTYYVRWLESGTSDDIGHRFDSDTSHDIGHRFESGTSDDIGHRFDSGTSNDIGHRFPSEYLFKITDECQSRPGHKPTIVLIYISSERGQRLSMNGRNVNSGYE